MQKYEKQQPVTTFRPMSIVAKRSPISATAELLSYTVVYFFYYSVFYVACAVCRML